MISFPRLPSTSDKTVSAAITSSKPIAITCSLLMGSCSSAIVLTSILINLININAMTWITAHEAVELTGVRMQTLYAYVSRGKIRSRQDGADSRRSLYHRDDVVRMAGRQRGQRNAATVASGAMEWGDPVMPSAISTVRDGRLWYRGADAVELARASQLEDIAAVLWETGDASVDLAAVPAGAAPPPGEAGAIQPGIVAMAGRCVADLPTQAGPWARSGRKPAASWQRLSSRCSDPRRCSRAAASASSWRLPGNDRARNPPSGRRCVCWRTTSSMPRPSPRA